MKKQETKTMYDFQANNDVMKKEELAPLKGGGGETHWLPTLTLELTIP